MDCSKFIDDFIRAGIRLTKVAKNGKIPVSQDWTNVGVSASDILTWVEEGGNVGAVLDAGWVVIDIDPRNGGDVDAVCSELGIGLDKLVAVKTPGGGYHIYFRLPVGKVLNVKRMDLPGVDILSHGRQCLIPGSVIDGIAYCWFGDLRVENAEYLPRYLLKSKRLGDSGLEGDKLRDSEIELIVHFLNRLSPIDFSDYEEWLRLMMALHHASAGSEKVMKAYQEWSRMDARYDTRKDSDAVEKKWKGFKFDGRSVVTLKSYTKYDIDGVLSELKLGSERGKNVGEVVDDAYLQKEFADYAVVNFGSAVSIIHELKDEDGVIYDIELKTKADLLLWYDSYPLVRMKGSRRSVSPAEAWMKWDGRRSYEAVVFDPSMRAGLAYNIFRGFIKRGVDEGYSERIKLWDDHILRVMASGNTEWASYIHSWIADAVQNTGRRPGVTLVFRGDKGTGKGIVVSKLGEMFGSHYLYIGHNDRVTGRFNSRLMSKCLVFVDEAFFSGDRSAENVLKSLITEPRLEIEFKGKEPIVVDNHLRFIFATNNDWAVPASVDERRYAVFDVKDCQRGDFEYFSALSTVSTLDLWKRYSSCEVGSIRDLPRTPALFEQIVQSWEPLERFWYETLVMGGFLVGASLDWEHSVGIGLFYAKYLEFTRHKVGRVRRNNVGVSDIVRFFTRYGERIDRRVVNGGILYFGSIGDARADFMRWLKSYHSGFNFNVF